MIIRFLIAAVILYIFYRIGRRFFLPTGRKVKPLPRDQQTAGRPEDLVEDPNCHTYIPMGEACTLNRGDQTYHFCSRRCMEEYEKKIMNKAEDV